MKHDHLDIAHEYSALLRTDEADDRQPGSFRLPHDEAGHTDENGNSGEPGAGGDGPVIPRVVPSHEDERAGGVAPEELSLWGAGPRIVVPALLAQLGGAGLTLALPGPFGMEMLPHWAWVLMGLCALLLGTLAVRRPGRN